MGLINQQQRTALSFNGRTWRFERQDVGSNPAGAAILSYPKPAR